MREIIKAGLGALVLAMSLAAPAAAGQPNPFDAIGGPVDSDSGGLLDQFDPDRIAAQLADGEGAFARGDYATALRLWTPLADRGNAKAQANLGAIYAGGLGVPQNYAAAVEWFRKAADQGNADGQTRLGQMYFIGEGVPRDYVEAAKWLRVAANQGDEVAQASLGVMYFIGQGVPQDFVLSYMWSNLSAAQGFESAANVRDKIMKLMTPEQIAKSQKLAREWKPTTHGHPDNR